MDAKINPGKTDQAGNYKHKYRGVSKAQACKGGESKYIAGMVGRKRETIGASDNIDKTLQVVTRAWSAE